MDEIEEKLEMILEWAADNPDFDTEFVESVKEYYEENGEISESQDEALDNILYRWKII